MSDAPNIAIIGAGPCGLGCARELNRLGHENWTVYERNDRAAGLAGSVTDPQGFTWDFGGHVVFSHYGEFDKLLDEIMGDEVYSHERSSYVRFDDRWVPYPFQNNLRHLPPEIAYECILGLIEATGGNAQMDFAQWMEATFGGGITHHFMRPYNFKVWATPPERMSAQWMAERVSVVDHKRALRSLIFQEDDAAWGPNNLFVFPAVGGTGEIYRRLAQRLGERITFGRDVASVDVETKTLRFTDGSSTTYDYLVSTMPVDILVRKLVHCPDNVRGAAEDLEHNGVYMVGVGYETPLKDDKSWLYFPQDHAPFYRATNFAKYSPANVPDGDTARYCSYMTEVSYSRYKPEDQDGLGERVEEGLRAAGVIEGTPDIASLHVEDIPYAYPVPTMKRDDALATIQPWLMNHHVYSRGRFGSWKYEIGNMDHAVKMGTDIARRLVDGTDEEIWSV
ncbi:MAG TPA: FAD-dependent oxidoreductase [Actinomycetota bacterium]|nr:FAD-dependent oxidoreductase [Actinomycetota bacterium]